MFSNQQQLFDNLRSSLQAAQLQRHRVMLVLTGDAKQYTNEVCRSFEQHLKLPDSHSNRDISDQINTLLGCEHQCIVFDAHGSFDERLFAASAGTVVAGGLFVLETPALAAWSQNSLFIKRLIRVLFSQHLQIFEVAGADSTILLSLPIISKPDNILSDKPTWIVEQNQLAQRLKDNLHSTASSINVVQGDRGRGKSALVGRAIQALSTTPRSISMTANRPSACHVLLQHAQQAIAFTPISKALETTHDVLIVEEAGSIPIAILERLIGLSQSVIFITTVQGYEGAGRGFAIRFARTLDELEPDWLKLTPSQPVRWSPGDPLEAFVNSALLLDAEIPIVDQANAFTPRSANVELVGQQRLASDDHLLEAVFGLLVQAHYQTTPADLRNMLDKPNVLVFTQRVGKILTGAALVALEGNIPVELHAAIRHKQRRLADQILPQLLAQSAASQEILSDNFARIVRIAVHPELRDRGLGTQLFQQLSILLSPTTENVGASFGADEQSVSFWLKQGLIPIHYGYRANPRSGLRSACFINRGCDAVSVAVNKASWILNQNLQALATAQADREPVIKQLIKNTSQSGTQPTENELEELIADFCQAQRSFIDTAGIMLSEKMLTDDEKCEVMQLLCEYTPMPPKDRRLHEARLRTRLSHAHKF